MDLAAINNVRKLQGLEPLTELPGENTPTTTEPTPEEIEAKRVADEAASKAEKEKSQPNPDADPELSDDQLLKLLAKKGITATSFEDLKKPAVAPDPVKEAELREANELAYGLTKGLFNKKDYDGFIHDSQSKQDFVYAQYHAEQKAEDPELTDEEIQAEFMSKHGLDAEPGTRRHKRGVKEVNTLAESLLRQKYGKIYDAKEAFASHEKQSATQAADDAKVVSGTSQYKTDVESIFSELSKIPVKFSDTESIEVPVMQEYLDELKAVMLKPDKSKEKILAGYDKKTMKEEVFAAFLYKNFPYLAKEIANQHLMKHSAGTKGIPNLGGVSKKQGDTPQLTDAQKTLIALMEKEKQAAAVN